MLRPNLSGDAFIRRHQNPAGMILRGVVLLILLVALWTQRPGLLVLAMLIETANWLYCPEESNPPEWLEQILDMEFALLDMPPGGLKTALLGAFGAGTALICLGLWAHHFTTVLLALVLLGAAMLVLRRIATR